MTCWNCTSFIRTAVFSGLNKHSTRVTPGGEGEKYPQDNFRQVNNFPRQWKCVREGLSTFYKQEAQGCDGINFIIVIVIIIITTAVITLILITGILRHVLVHINHCFWFLYLTTHAIIQKHNPGRLKRFPQVSTTCADVHPWHSLSVFEETLRIDLKGERTATFYFRFGDLGFADF